MIILNVFAKTKPMTIILAKTNRKYKGALFGGIGRAGEMKNIANVQTLPIEKTHQIDVGRERLDERR